jgi:two-component system, OmpR family, sensor kinase
MAEGSGAAPGGRRRSISPRRWPVRWRLAGVSAALTLVILVLFALVVGRLATERVKDDFRQDMVSVASQFRNTIQLGPGAPGGVSGTDVAGLAMAGQAAVRIVDAQGNVAPHDGLPLETPGAPDLGPPNVGQITSFGDFDVVSLLVSDVSIPPLYVQYARSRSSLEATLSKLWLFLAFGVMGGTIMAALAGVAVAGRAMRPISSLTAAARKITETRDPSLRLPMPETEDEVAELAKTLDQMLRELDAARSETEQMIQAQRDFVADASHELRTPLTSILANLELLEASFAEREADPDEEEIVAGALGSSRRMRRLVADLLLLARADAGRTGPRRLCDLSEIAGGAIAEVRPVAEAHRLELLTYDTAVEVLGNPDDLHRLVLNLAENGVRHTPPGSTVSVAVRASDAEAVVEVTDDGPGLPQNVGDQIFARFVRGDGPSDLAADSGTGLGLAIVKAVAVSHSGRVEVGAAPEGGARFTVRLPLATRQPAAAGVD